MVLLHRSAPAASHSCRAQGACPAAGKEWLRCAQLCTVHVAPLGPL